MTDLVEHIEKVKSRLFDLIVNRQQLSQRQIIERILKEIEYIPVISKGEIILQETNVISQSVKSYTLHQNSMIKMEMIDLFLEKENGLHQVEPYQNNIYIFKFERMNFFRSLIIIEIYDIQIKNELEKLARIINRLLVMLLSQEGRSYEKNHSDFLLNLASKLMGIHRTSEALELMIDNLGQYLPEFNYKIWMLNEVEDTSLNIKLVDLNKIYKKMDGYKALYYQKIEIVHNEDKKETVVYIPFKGKRSVNGMLEVEMNGIFRINQSDVEVIEHFAKMMGEVIERTRLYQSSTKQIKDLELINYTTHELNSNLEESEIVSIIDRQINNYSYPEQYAIAIKREELNELDIVAQQADFFDKRIGKKFLQYVSQNVERTKRPMFYGDYNGMIHDIPYKSLVALPLHAENNYLGVLILAHSTRYYFSHDTFKLFQSITRHASIALMNTMLKEQLKKSIITDYLTELYTRNYIDSYITHHMKRGSEAAFILYDVDDFKLINDEFGHYMGDRALKQVAQIIRSHLTDDQIAARWGGEEFAVYLPNLNVDEAKIIANKIREDIKEHSSPKVTVSGGIASWSRQSEDTIESLFIRADEALYKAKSLGKNQIIIDDTISMSY